MKRILITLMAVCQVVVAFTPTEAQEIFSENGNLYSTRQLSRKAVAEVGNKVIIRSAAALWGNLKIVAVEGSNATIKYYKKAKAEKRSRAVDYIDLISVNLETIPGGVKLVMKAPNPAPWGGTNESGSVVAQLQIPENCDLDIDAHHFDIEAKGPFKSFLVPSSLGRLDVTFVTDELELSTSNRRINIENISGEVNVSTTNSDLVAANIKAGNGRAVFRNEGGDIEILGVSGEINVKNSYGRIDIDDFAVTGKKNSVRGVYGPITIVVTEMGDGRLVVSNRLEDIDLTVPSNISAVWSLAVEEEGKIEVANIGVTPDLVQPNRLNLISGDGKAFIDGSVRGEGNVYVRGYDPED